MNRVTVALSDLKPNPFKKDICGGRLDPEVVSQIKESATKTSFWEQWVVRKTDAGYEMAFGHHRLQAAIELFGAAHRVGVQLEDYSDEQMMIALADENSGDEASTEERVDTVVRAGKGLRNGEFKCRHKVIHAESPSKTGEQHKCGSERCISAFLGSGNWPQPTVHRLLELEKLDKQALASVADSGETHPNRPSRTKDEPQLRNILSDSHICRDAMLKWN